MINTAKCELCVHNQVCKISEEIMIFIDKLHIEGLNDIIPKGVTLDLSCNHYKHGLHEYVC